MLIVHNPKTTDFNNYGKGILDKVVLRGIFTHKINSACTITLDLIKEDITGDIMKEDIIVAPTPFGNQPFRVFDINPLGADRVEVVARHVFFDLQKRIVKRCKVDNANGQTILTKYLANLDKPVPHKLYSNITETASLDWQLKQGVDILLGDEENSFVNKLGGELRVDGFNAYIDRQIGRDRGFTARFRKNITGFTGKTTVDGLITRIIPKGFDGITLENDGYVDSTLIGNYSEIYTSVIEFPDVKYSQSPNNSNKEGFATLEEARAELIKRTKAYFEESGCDLPRSSFNINLIMLKDMVEYKDIAISEEIQLGDTITVDYTPYNLKLQKRLTGYTYNLLTQRMETLEIGDFGKDYFKELSNKIDKIEMPDFEEVKGGLEQDFQDKLEEFSDNLINGGNGSYVKFKPNFQNPSEILIMDNQDESKAKNVIRLNKEGIGASTTGVTGTYYGLAKDGKLIITEATANVIVASLIKGGMLQSNDGSTWINMDDGTFSFKNKIKFEGDKLSIILDDGSTIEQKITGAIETANGFTAEKVSEIKSDINGVTLKVSNVEKSLSTTNGNLSNLTERVSEAESKITESAIINTVSSAINTAKDEAINSANSSTDSKLAGYATTSSLTQTAENITAKFTSSGGVNLVRNGDFKNGTSNWWSGEYYPDSTNRDYYVWDDSNEWVLTGTHAIVIRGSWLSTGEQRWDCAKFPVKANTTYTLSFLVSSHRTSRIGVYVRGNEWEVIASHSEDIWGQGYSGGKDRRLWKKFVLTFNSGNNYQANVNLMMLESQDDGFAWFTEVMVNEGNQPMPFTPHSEELVNGSTVIDGSGVTVNNGALRVKNNSGTTVLQGDSLGNLSMRGSIETINDYGRLYLNGNSLKGFLNPSSTTPIYASGVWRPYNDSYQTGYVSVGNTNALIGDDNGCLYMSGDNNPNGTRAMLKYSRNSGNVFGAVEFTQYGGTSLVSSLNGGRDTYGIWNSAEGYVLPFKGNEYLGRNNRYWEAIYVRTTVSYNLNSVIDESKLLGEVQSETQRNKINTPTKKDFIECIKELDFGVYDSSDNINVRVLKTTNELTCKPIINTSLKLGVNNARNLLVKECTDREGENPIQTIDLTSYCSALAITLQDTIGKIESLEQENQELKDRLDKLEKLVQSIVNK